MRKPTAYLCLFLAYLTGAPGVCKELGTFGATYEIVEKDFLEEMYEKARQADWAKMIDRKKFLDSAKSFRPELKPIPPVGKDRIFTVSMSYALEFDITDGRRNVLYPKGYTFNPLAFVNYDRTLVIMDAGDRRQVEWFTSSRYRKDLKTVLIITGGSYYDLTTKLRRPVYYATPALLEKFRIAAVPSVVTQKGTVMEIREIRVKEGAK